MSELPRYSKTMYWLHSHIRALIYALGELYRTPIQSLSTLLVIAIAMALPIGLFSVLGSSRHLSENWHNQPSISLYLKANTTIEQAQQWLQQLKSQNDIQHVRYIAPEQGLKQFAQAANIENLIGSMQNNPLPGVITITPKANQQSPQHIQALAQQLSNNALVETVQVDQLWVKRFYYLMTIAKRFNAALAILFGIGVVLITSNTIRLSLQSHRQEIELLQMIGASRQYICRPMLYRGLLYGLLGGLIALLIITLLFHSVANPIQQLLATYGQAMAQTSTLLPATVAVIVCICACLGWLGAWLASRQYLR